MSIHATPPAGEPRPPAADESPAVAAGAEAHPSDAAPPSAEEFWDARFGASERLFSGEPNTALVREAADLPPGTALDLGCGEGGDAIWLARQGWAVTAVDVSPVALRRAAADARAAGVGDRIEWRHHDLTRSFPAGTYDLVSTHFLYPPPPVEREPILRRAADAVAPGGVFLVVSHAGPLPWQGGEGNQGPELRFPSPEEILGALDLPAGAWQVLVSEVYERPLTDPDGRPTSRRDSTLKLRRHGTHDPSGTG